MSATAGCASVCPFIAPYPPGMPRNTGRPEAQKLDRNPIFCFQIHHNFSHFPKPRMSDAPCNFQPNYPIYEIMAFLPLNTFFVIFHHCTLSCRGFCPLESGDFPAHSYDAGSCYIPYFDRCGLGKKKGLTWRLEYHFPEGGDEIREASNANCHGYQREAIRWEDDYNSSQYSRRCYLRIVGFGN